MDVGAELQALFDAEIDELLPEDLRMTRDVIDMLLGIDGRDLAAELAEALDDADRRISMARVVSGREPYRARTDDRDVADALAHSGCDATPRRGESRRRASARSRVRNPRRHALRPARR